MGWTASDFVVNRNELNYESNHPFPIEKTAKYIANKVLSQTAIQLRIF